jgi:hypothetical protein
MPNVFPEDPVGKASGSALRVHRLLQPQPILSIATASGELKFSVPTVALARNPVCSCVKMEIYS